MMVWPRDFSSGATRAATLAQASNDAAPPSPGTLRICPWLIDPMTRASSLFRRPGRRFILQPRAVEHTNVGWELLA